jgi:hypothetical protein
MPELLRDSVWTFFGALLALAAILVSIAVYYAQKQRKRVTVETLARVPLIALGKEGIEGLAITFNGEPIQKATVVLIRVANAGNAPILSADFEAPLSFEFSPESKILSASIVSSEPPKMPITVSVAGPTATLSPHLLNPTDSLTCRVLLSASDSKFTSQGRIVGVKQIKGARRVSVVAPLSTLICMAVVVGAFWLWPAPASRCPYLRPEEMPFAAVMILAFLVSIIINVGDARAGVKRRREERRLLHADEV